MQQTPKTGAAAHLYSNEVEALTKKILSSYHRTTSELIEIGRCLAKLKKLLQRRQFLTLLDTRLNMSPTQAVRLIALFQKFHSAKSSEVLRAKPTVLYLLAESNAAVVKDLTNGKSVMVAGAKKTASQLTVKEAKQLTVCAQRSRRGPKAHDAHRDLATIMQRLRVWAFDAERVIGKFDSQQRKLTLIALKGAMECLQSVAQQLR